MEKQEDAESNYMHQCTLVHEMRGGQGRTDLVLAAHGFWKKMTEATITITRFRQLPMECVTGDTRCRIMYDTCTLTQQINLCLLLKKWYILHYGITSDMSRSSAHSTCLHQASCTQKLVLTMVHSAQMICCSFLPILGKVG